MSKGRFMLGVGPGGLASDFELFKNPDVHARNRMVAEADRPSSSTSGRTIRPTISKASSGTCEIKDAIMPELGVGYMPKPYQQGGPPISISLASPSSPSAALAARRGWGIISANIIPTYSVASHWAVYSKACAELGIPARGESWRVARNVMVAPSEQEAQDRVFGEQGSNRYFFTYIRDVLNRVNILVILKPRPGHAGRGGHARGHLEGMRDLRLAEDGARQARRLPRAGRPVRDPADDRPRLGRRNEAWERDSMRLLADDVMPKFRQHVMARAAAE